MKVRYFTSIILCLLLQHNLLFAHIRLPAVISSNMVIQRDGNVPIWGWADPGEQVRIKASWLVSDTAVRANEKGEWVIGLDSPCAGGPHEIRLTGKNEIILDNILAGEVWFASGQSNMAMALEGCDNAESEIDSSRYPAIRLFHIDRTFSEERLSDCKGSWRECRPESVRDFSAVAYYFGCELHTTLDVPVGLISASKGGSPAEAWMPAEVLRSDSALHTIFHMWKKWEEEYLGAEAPKTEAPEAFDMVTKPHRRPGALYNAMVAPVIPFAIKGVIWYQGENNVPRPLQYERLFRTLISSWREGWRQGDLPFYYVQITPYCYKDNLVNASLLRESQMKVLSANNTGMVVTTDIGDLNDGHPRNKYDVGRRLALLALADTYGYDDMVYSGPVYTAMHPEGDTLRLHFKHTGSGLVCRGDSLTCFQVSGSDGEFVRAEAVIDGSTVLVYNKHVTCPEAVRFGWMINTTPNLFNAEGLPAAPFRTDECSIGR